MSDGAALLYLEADDEVTSVVRRLRQASEPRVVLVAPGRSRAISSVVVMRLLARAAAEQGREIAVVGDALTRSLAAEAALPAYATVDDARSARSGDDAAAAAPEPPHRAGIHVVRGPEADDSAPTLAAAVMPDPGADSAETLSMPSVAAAPVAARRSTPRRRPGSIPLPLAAGAAVLALLALAGTVGAVALLPSATVVLVPREIEITDRQYVLRVEDAERRQGVAEASATVTATGTYEILEPATGEVTFRNWNTYTVRVPAGYYVAAGEQAFETLGTVDVPPGRLTSNGLIQAGEASVAVIAAAPGPAANVAAQAIDRVLDAGIAAQLRGFQNNPERIVLNAAPTSGGAAGTGPEITQQDVDAARAALVEQLTDRAEGQHDANVLRVSATTPTEPVIEGLDGLVGTRDVAEVEIGGSLAYDEWLVDLGRLRAEAEERMRGDPTAVPDGFVLEDGRTVTTVVDADAGPEEVTVTVEVSGVALPIIDAEQVRARIAGLRPEEAEARLADVGDASVRLWPDWAETVPGFEWRIEVVIDEPTSRLQPASLPRLLLSRP